MAYLSQLGGAESCGPDQQWDPDAVFKAPDGSTIKGQCVPKKRGTSILDIGKAALKAAAGATGKGASQRVDQAGAPDNTLVYVGVGAVALLAAFLLTRD